MEVWKDIKIESVNNYQVSNLGNVRVLMEKGFVLLKNLNRLRDITRSVLLSKNTKERIL